MYRLAGLESSAGGWAPTWPTRLAAQTREPDARRRTGRGTAAGWPPTAYALRTYRESSRAPAACDELRWHAEELGAPATPGAAARLLEALVDYPRVPAQIADRIEHARRDTQPRMRRWSNPCGRRVTSASPGDWARPEGLGRGQAGCARATADARPGRAPRRRYAGRTVRPDPVAGCARQRKRPVTAAKCWCPRGERAEALRAGWRR